MGGARPLLSLIAGVACAALLALTTCTTEETPAESAGGSGGSGSGGEGGVWDHPCPDVRGVWSLEGDCYVSQCNFEQDGCSLTVICTPQSFEVTGMLDATGNLTIGNGSTSCTGTMNADTASGTCDRDNGPCSWTATRGPTTYTGWGCEPLYPLNIYNPTGVNACVCDEDGEGSNRVPPNNVACPPQYPCCRLFTHEGARRCACYPDPTYCADVDMQRPGAMAVPACPPS